MTEADREAAKATAKREAEKIKDKARLAEQRKSKGELLRTASPVRRSHNKSRAKETKGDDDPAPAVPRLAYSIAEFCRAFGISPAFYYKFRYEGLGPREMHIGGRVMISLAAASEWALACEQRSQQQQQDEQQSERAPAVVE